MLIVKDVLSFQNIGISCTVYGQAVVAVVRIFTPLLKPKLLSLFAALDRSPILCLTPTFGVVLGGGTTPPVLAVCQRPRQTATLNNMSLRAVSE